MANGTSVGRLFWSTGLDTTGLKRDSKKAQGALSGLFKPSIIGATLLAGALVKAGDAALDFAREFETAFAEVQTISAAAREGAESMRESILQLTTEIPVGAVDATKALYQIVSAGQDGADALTLLEVSAKAAVAGVSTTAIAADVLTTIINSYGLAATDATKISDALFKTVELGKTTLTEIGASFAQVSALASSFGIEVNDVLAGIAAVTKQGTTTSEAITNLRGAIVALGKEFGNDVFRGRTLGEAFQFARDEADKSGKSYAEFFGRVQASLGILQLTGDKAVLFSESLDKINDSAGSTEKALAIMNSTFDSQSTLLKNNVIVAFSGFGNLLKSSILPLMKLFNESFDDEILKGAALAVDKERIAVEKLVFDLNDVNISEEDRLKILEKIQKIAPEVAKEIKKEGDQYVIATGALVEYNTQKLNQIILAQKLQSVQQFNAAADLAGQQAQEKLAKVQEQRIEAFNIIAKKSKEDAEIVKATLDGSIKLGTTFAEVSARFGEDTALFLNQAGLQQSANEKDFVNFQNIAIRQLAQRNGLTLEAIGLNEEFFDIVKEFNELFNRQTAAQINAKSIDEARVKLAKLLGIEIDKNTKKTEKKKKPEAEEATGRRSFAEIKKELDELNKQILDAEGAERSAIALKILELEKELKLREDIAKVEISIAKNEKLKPKEFKSGRVVTKKGDVFTIGKGDIKIAKSMVLEVEKLKKLFTDTDDKSDNFINNIQDAEFIFANLAGELERIDPELAKAADTLGLMANIIGSFATGDIAGGVAGTVSLFLDSIIPTDDQIDKFDFLNQGISNLINQLNTARSALAGLGSGDVVNSLAAIENGLLSVRSGIRSLDIPKVTGDWLAVQRAWLGGTESLDGLDKKIEELSLTLIGAGTTLNEEQKENIESLIQSYQDLKDEWDSIVSEITGTTIQDLSDSLAEAFLNGEEAAESWGRAVDDIIKKIIRDQLTAELLTGPITEAVRKLVVATDDGLDLGEAGEFRDAIQGITESVAPAFEEARKALEELGLDFGTGAAAEEQGISGAIRRELTEETGGLLLGITRRNVDENIKHTDILTEANNIQTQIAANTLRTAVAVESMDNKITQGQDGRDLGV